MSLKSCAVFCGSRLGNSPAFAQAAKEAGKILAQKNILLVYGGGNDGLMGLTASSCLAHGGKVKAFIPHFLKTLASEHPEVTDLETTETMGARKVRMMAESEASLILSGGLGTLDEWLDVMVERQLHLAEKPIYLLNTEKWADPMLKTFDAAVEQGFADETIRDFLHILDTPAQLSACLG